MIVIYLLGFGAKAYLLKAHLYAYTQSLKVYYANLASTQVWQVVAQLGTCSLVIAAIEKYRQPWDDLRKLMFYVIFVSECVWGLISGMKGLSLMNFVVVFLVASVVQRRLRAKWGLVAVVALILLYPLNSRYRTLVREGGMGVTSLSDALSAGELALSQTAQAQQSFASWFEDGVQSTIVRLDWLRIVGWVISDGARFPWLQTKRYWWTLPLYPFVPRLIWPSKPIGDQGAQLNVALGGNSKSAAAITYPGDLYLEFGLPGVLVGMFVLGMFCQWLTAHVSGRTSERRLFVFASMFPFVIGLEADAFGFWAGTIKWLAIVSALAWLVYGSRRRV
jgi:hypothetical protein